ncbi:MAG: prolipoprotein diacylglyceryl transferase [Prevotellaceae bacterium]|jgi:phosphatidylglycerol:prolipoprotein diacylglycerol transferase|nr:prolipoprotein diacylglyceryl transferase [Prevotellaceae bacterium]
MHQYLPIGNSISIPMYNLLIGIGAILGFLHLEQELKQNHIDFKTDRKIYFSLIISLLFGFTGAKLVELFYHGYVLNWYTFRTGGITFMGGFVVGAIVFLLMNVILKINNLRTYNLLIPSIIIAHCFGRIGCFFAGCCYGKPTDSIFGVVFPSDAFPSLHLGAAIPVHPTQLYEAFCLVLLFIIIKIVCVKYRLPIYLIGYSVSRFFIEFLRGDDRGNILINILTPSQVLSIIFFIVGLVIVLFSALYTLK